MADEIIIIPEEASILDILLHENKMARYPEQEDSAVQLLTEMVNELLSIDDKPDEAGIISFLTRRIKEIDELLTAQINEILRHSEFQKLEGSWRGLYYLVMNSETGTRLKIRLMNASLKDLRDDLTKAIEFDQSALFKKIYEEEYGTYGGSPYSCIIGDFMFTNHPQDIQFLEHIANLAAAAHAPFISAVSPLFFNLDKYEDMPLPRDLAKILESPDYIKWTSFRNMEDSRYVALLLPRILMRLPYGPNTLPVAEFDFTEDVGIGDTNRFCWGNPAYALAQRITDAFAKYSWTAAIRGVEGGGLVEGLPSYVFKTLEGDKVVKCPTEVAITDRREKELSDLGFIAACHCKGTDYAVFFGAQTAQKPKLYNKDDANANASISARITYILAASRFAHYIKVLMRDKVGSFLTKENVEQYLNTWIASYILLNDDAPASLKSSYPLREGRIDVYDVPGSPGSYKSVIYLRPHFQMEELTASIRLVATLPARAG
ncbi:MAG: type VI secretion system contractile sheath large subunit [Holosporales bacterium]|jgi:type VI secretion system protein ImpC|nr:type VI secretion system contractile sheath large subunit [Holosporales bacterium]